MMIIFPIFIVIFSLLAGCASSPDEVRSAYVSPLKYKDYDCGQISQEMDYISQETNKLYFSLKKKSSDDNVQMAVGLVLFWPALFLLEGGDGNDAAQYAQMKGDFEAARQASIKRRCDFKLPRSPSEIMKDKADKELIEKQRNDALPN